jgi:signal transduction histidine kinase
MTRPGFLPTSFRGRFLLVVFVAAVVPLGLIGIWLTRSVARAGQELLRSELVQSLETISAPVAARWSYRIGDLQLLANNEVATRAFGSGGSGLLSPADSTYLGQLFASMKTQVPSFEYHDATGRLGWSTPIVRRDTLDGRGQPILPPGPTMIVRFPVPATGAPGSAGELVAQVAIASIIPIDTALRLPSGARLQLVQRGAGIMLLPVFAADSLIGQPRFTVDGADWLAVHQSLDAPALDVILAAPLEAYVRPFERAARVGIITLGVAAVLALLIAAYLTRRVTASLERLAVAADAVAAGDLEHRMDGTGPDEVGRVVTAFNSMVQNLRRTLSELSQRQALAAVGEYAATLSHEVRNGLTAIRVDLQRAEEKTGRDIPGRPLITRALENLKRLDGIVSRSLHLSRNGRLRRRRLDLRSVLNRAAQAADPSFSERGTTLQRDSEEPSPSWILGDNVALEQLVLNLLLNAAQALEKGGSAHLTLESDGADARIVVTDSGAGIAAVDLEHVLDPFFSTKDDGTGLGLPIARQIAVTHGGSLSIESTLGQGTRVEVRLPLAGAPIP